MGDILDQLQEVNAKLRNKFLDSDERSKLLDFREQLLAKLSELSLMEIIKDER